jgi:hypothetical protein
MPIVKRNPPPPLADLLSITLRRAEYKVLGVGGVELQEKEDSMYGVQVVRDRR